jgi:hypothetical protein
VIVFSHLVNTPNTGDRASGPYQWFGFPSHRVVDARSSIPEYRVGIFGGGALTGLLSSVCRDGATNIAWGVGSSVHGGTTPLSPPRSFDLVGVRDYDDPSAYVPCASCMSSLFDEDSDAVHEAVLFVNADPSIAVRYPLRLHGLPTMDNRQPLSHIVPFLRSGATVVSNSYHGCYWATLLGRRVVAVAYSSKFYGFKFKPGMSIDGSDWYRKRPRRYSDALEDSRTINRNFYHRVISLLARHSNLTDLRTDR